MSSVPAIVKAMKAALIGDDQIRLLAGDKVYAGRAPQGTPPNYVVIGDITAEDLGTFTGGIEQGSDRLSLWGRDVDSVLDLYSHTRRVLHRQVLQLDGGAVHISGWVRLVTSFTDPTDKVSQQAVVEYTWICQK